MTEGDEESIMRNVEIVDNIILNSGEGFGSTRFNKETHPRSRAGATETASRRY